MRAAARIVCSDLAAGEGIFGPVVGCPSATLIWFLTRWRFEPAPGVRSDLAVGPDRQNESRADSGAARLTPHFPCNVTADHQSGHDDRYLAHRCSIGQFLCPWPGGLASAAQRSRQHPQRRSTCDLCTQSKGLQAATNLVRPLSPTLGNLHDPRLDARPDDPLAQADTAPGPWTAGQHRADPGCHRAGGGEHDDGGE